MSRIINKVIDNSNANSEMLLDLTEDTVNESNLLLNETAHNREGEPIRGTHISGGAVNSVNGKTGTVILDGTDIILTSALPIGGQTKTQVEDSIKALNDVKVDKVAGKGLSAEDYTSASKTKLDGLANIKSIGVGLSLNSSTGELTATGGSGGHTILNESGTELPQRSKLQFEGCEVTDDSTNDITKIKAEGGVTGIKGNNESTYRTGNVNLTHANLGMDTTPTANSTNPVTSGALKTALDGKVGTSGASTNTTVAFTSNDLAANTTEKTSNTTNQPSTVAKLSSGETLASMFGKISSMFASVRKLWNTVGFETSGVSKVVGDTSVKFTNSAIKTTSELELLCENSTNTPIFYTGVTVTNGSATYTFNALTVATTFYLKVR